MKKSLKLYKEYSLDNFKTANVSMTRKYHYFSETDLKTIKEDKFENTNNDKAVSLIDEDYEWDPKQQSLYLDIELVIQNPSVFYESNVCEKDAVVSIGLEWCPLKSKIKKCCKIGDILNQEGKLVINKNDVEIENLASNTDFNLIIYISKPGAISTNKFIANKTGIVLFRELMWSIIVSGDGSLFPIFETDSPADAPLWRIEINTDDIESDFFDKDHVKILINKKHQSYMYYSSKSADYNKNFETEVLSSAVAVLILELRNKQDGKVFVFNDEYPEEGSIAQALIYLKDTKGFKINDDYSELVYSIKTFFDGVRR